MTEQEDEIGEILKKFPFHGRNSKRQVAVLSSYLMEAPGNNKKNTAEKLDVNRNTVNKIEDSWSDLSLAEKVRLVDFLRRKFAETHFSNPDKYTASPEAASL